MVKVAVTKAQFKLLRQEKAFISAIRIARMLNSIRGSQSIIQRSLKIGTSRLFRDKLEAILYHGAVLYEVLKTFVKNHSQYTNLPEYNESKKDIQYLRDEINNKTSFQDMFWLLFVIKWCSILMKI